MKLVFTSYSSSPKYNEPLSWLKRIEAYTGILEALSKKHTVISIERINYEGELLQQGVQYYFMRQNKKVLLFPFRQHRFISKLRPDVIFINGFIFPLQIIQLRLKVGKKPKIIILHRAEKPFRGVKKYVQKIADKYIDAYLFISLESAGEWLKQRIIKTDRKIFEVIQASSVFHPPAFFETKKTLVFLWVGRLDANKDPLTVIKAFIQLLRYNSCAQLFMIYQEAPLLEQVKNIIQSDDVASNSIKLIGAVAHYQLEAWYHSADFIISASHYEGSGIAVCEAMSCGCIPIVTNITSFRKMTDDGKYGFLYDAGNSASLLQILLHTKNIDVVKEKEKVLEQFKNELSFEAIARKIDQSLQTI
jgi:glycosyltransferase involved in cell wall biosynthesis